MRMSICERYYALPLQGDRPRARQVTVHGERGGRVAQVRDGAEGEARRDEAVLLKPAPQRPEERPRAQPRRAREAAAEGPGPPVRPPVARRPGARHIARELGAERGDAPLA